MKRILLITAFLLGFGVYVFSQMGNIPVTWGNTSLTYNGNAQAPTATAVIPGTNIPVAITVTGQQTNVGKGYTATATTTTGYQLLNATTYFTIAALTIPVQWGNTSLTYNGQIQRPTASVTGVGKDRLALRISGGQTNVGGQYSATASLYPVNSNYILSNNSTTFSIAPASVPVVWGNTTLTYNGSPQAPTATAMGVVNENLPLSVLGAQTNIGGPYTATASLIPTNNNYTLSNTSTTFSIVQSPTNTYTVVWSNTSLTYNGTPQAPTAVATNVQGATVAVTVTGAQTNAGSYTATAAAGPNTSVTLTNATTQFVINRATVPVVWGNTTLTYNGSPQAPTATATGVMNENLPINVTGAQTNVGGPYTATAAFSQTSINYTLSNTTTTFTIIQSATNTYTVAWSNTSLTYNGNPQAPTATATNASGTSIAVTVTGERTNAGTRYTATAALTTPNPDITLNNTTTQFDITPATVPVVWGNTTLTYTGSPQAPTATASGVNNENLPLTVTGAQTNIGGPYTATAAFSQTNSNYTLSNTTTTFTIIQSSTNTYTVVWSNTSLTYNGNPQAPTAIATNDQGQTLQLTVTGAEVDAGIDYLATASPATPNSSIVLINPTTLFDITPESLEIAAVNETIVFGQTPELAYTVKSGQLFGSDALAGVLSVETLQGMSPQTPYAVGEYVIAQGTLTASSNYTINFSKGSLTVIESNIFDIIVNSKSATYEGDKYYGEPAENGENQAEVYVLANPGETIEIGGLPLNPRTVALPLYGDNLFTITVTQQNGASQNHTLIIERYYEKVYFEYPDVPTISCNTQTNGGLSFTGFQWHKVGDPEFGKDATGQYYQVKDNATYYCELTAINYNNTKIRTINVRPIDLRTSGSLTAYPNPTQGKVTILRSVNGVSTQTESSAKPKIQVFDLNGVLVLQPETNPFDMSALPQGMYFIKMNGETAKVIKTN